VRKIKGNFCSRVFTSSGTESVIFFKEGKKSNRDLFSLKLKLDNFTSGFWTRYADMAGGWEEVVTVDSGIRTVAGTGELIKKARPTRALKILVWRTGPLKAKDW
jgi:hypothetical protein